MNINYDKYQRCTMRCKYKLSLLGSDSEVASNCPPLLCVRGIYPDKYANTGLCKYSDFPLTAGSR
jgi:hypothetical protein